MTVTRLLAKSIFIMVPAKLVPLNISIVCIHIAPLNTSFAPYTPHTHTMVSPSRWTHMAINQIHILLCYTLRLHPINGRSKNPCMIRRKLIVCEGVRVEPSKIIEKSKSIGHLRTMATSALPLNCLFVFISRESIYVIPISFAHMKIIRSFSVFVCACAATLLIYSHSQLGNINIFCSDEANSDFPHVWPDVPAGVASNEMNHFCFLLHKPGL